jgi:hypothetical protein
LLGLSRLARHWPALRLGVTGRLTRSVAAAPPPSTTPGLLVGGRLGAFRS